MPSVALLELRTILGDSILGELVGVPAASFSEVQSSALPPEVVGRIDLIGQVVWCLQGTYDHEGIRRWLGRPRQQLSGRSPADALGKDWMPAGHAAFNVLRLAQALAS